MHPIKESCVKCMIYIPEPVIMHCYNRQFELQYIPLPHIFPHRLPKSTPPSLSIAVAAMPSPAGTSISSLHSKSTSARIALSWACNAVWWKDGGCGGRVLGESARFRRLGFVACLLGHRSDPGIRINHANTIPCINIGLFWTCNGCGGGLVRIK